METEKWERERITTSGICFDATGRVLIAKREDKGSIGGKWEFPGGKNRDQIGETISETLQREWKEELGKEIEVKGLLATHEFINKGTLYHLKAYEVKLKDEGPFTYAVHTQFKWESLDKLRFYDFAPSDRAIIEKLGGKPCLPLIADMGRRLESSDGHTVICLTGGGGKTSSMVALGAYYRSLGKKVLIGTTTKVQSPRWYDFKADTVILDEGEFFSHEPEAGKTVFFAQGELMDPKKVHAPREEIFDLMTKNYDVAILEADGARMLPLKLHTSRDPVIPKSTTAVVALLGMSSFGQVAADVCMDEIQLCRVDGPYLQALLEDEEGVCKGMRPDTKNLVLFNQCDLLDARQLASIKALQFSCPALFGSVRHDCLC
ncbi:MAG: putative selenium-dependent hydroxylase accessory protein YqeC [Spirochaetia bacterium]|nr:putative selenium-dependent hydroxylase accessory protein YqeC [Spirochaetia bacterium]